MAVVPSYLHHVDNTPRVVSESVVASKDLHFYYVMQVNIRFLRETPKPPKNPTSFI